MGCSTSSTNLVTVPVLPGGALRRGFPLELPLTMLITILVLGLIAVWIWDHSRSPRPFQPVILDTGGLDPGAGDPGPGARQFAASWNSASRPCGTGNEDLQISAGVYG